MTDASIRTAVAAWLSDATAAEATYGHISTWGTSGVTDMSFLFCVRELWMDGQSRFDNCVLSVRLMDDITAWDTSGVTTMSGMFIGVSSFNQAIGVWRVGRVTDMSLMFNSVEFNQPIGDWDVSSVIDMDSMFDGNRNFNQPLHNWAIGNVRSMAWMFSCFGCDPATPPPKAFDQDLGWTLDGCANMESAFKYTPCESTLCGVVQESSCSTPVPTVTPDNTVDAATPARGPRGLVALVLALFLSL